MPVMLPALSAVEGPGDRSSQLGVRDSADAPKRLPGSTRAPKAERRTPMSRGLFFELPKAEKPKRAKAAKVKQKHDPKLVSAARELRDRYLEHVNADPMALEAPGGKYDVCKSSAGSRLGQIEATPIKQTPLLAAA
jgi:hypothetical protein